jgi:hypothetical protein
MLGRLVSWLSGDVSLRDIAPLRAGCLDAADLVDDLANGSARSAAWAAYAQQTYGDKLLAACASNGYLPPDTASVACAAYRLAAACLDVARGGGGVVPASLPHWRTLPRTHEQLVGMREALEALRTYLAYALPDGVPEVDAQLARVERLWIERAPAEIRGGLGDALANGLDLAYETGRRRFTT